MEAEAQEEEEEKEGGKERTGEKIVLLCAHVLV